MRDHSNWRKLLWVITLPVVTVHYLGYISHFKRRCFVLLMLFLKNCMTAVGNELATFGLLVHFFSLPAGGTLLRMTSAKKNKHTRH